jgi:hypothetical protein
MKLRVYLGYLVLLVFIFIIFDYISAITSNPIINIIEFAGVEFLIALMLTAIFFYEVIKGDESIYEVVRGDEI